MTANSFSPLIDFGTRVGKLPFFDATATVAPMPFYDPKKTLVDS